MTESQTREEICRVGRSLFERGYVHATAGNISVRLRDGGYLITPTDACLGFLDPECLARLDHEGRQVDGDRASKTIMLHRTIYAAASKYLPNTACIIHTHSTHCVAIALTGEGGEMLPAITPYFVMKVGRVPIVPYHPPGSKHTANAVERIIGDYGARGVALRAVMLSRLGPNVWQDTPAAAMATLEELEETARLWVSCNPKPQPLDDKQIADLRTTFGAHW